MLENFSQKNPGAFYGDYAASFGPPEEFAAQMLSNLDPEDVREARMRRKRALMLAGGDGLYWSGEDYELSAGFSDTRDHWSESYVEYCVDAGVISGGGDGCFDPDAHITGLEFAKMALAALGYDPVVYQLIGPQWATNVNLEALMTCSPSLYDGLDGVALSDPISREQAAQMMYNMLDNATIWAYPHNSDVLGEQTYEYGHKNGEDGQPMTFFEIHFTGRDREDIF